MFCQFSISSSFCSIYSISSSLYWSIELCDFNIVWNVNLPSSTFVSSSYCSSSAFCYLYLRCWQRSFSWMASTSVSIFIISNLIQFLMCMNEFFSSLLRLSIFPFIEAPSFLAETILKGSIPWTDGTAWQTLSAPSS